jgi:metal-responsive CopG/Arc/MetJ family transcriptional regulator
MPKAVVATSVDIPLAQKIEKMAKARGISMSRLIEKAVREYFRQIEESDSELKNRDPNTKSQE